MRGKFWEIITKIGVIMPKKHKTSKCGGHWESWERREKMFDQRKHGSSNGKVKVSGGYKQGNMNAFKFGNQKRKRRVIKRGK